MGYPSIKFFSPGTPAGDMGEERASRDKSIPAIKVIKWGGRFDGVRFKCDSHTERHGGLPEGAAGEEGEGRERMAQSLASRVSQRFVNSKSLQFN